MNSSNETLAPFLWYYHLDGMGGGENRSVPNVSLSPNSQGFDWWHLESNAVDTVNWLQSANLDPRIIEALTMDETRPKSMKLAGGTLVVLRGVNTNPGADPEDMVSIRIWFTNHLLISTRKSGRKLLSVQDVRATIDSNAGPGTVGELLGMLIERLADRINHVVEGIEDALEDIERNLDRTHIANVRKNLLLTRQQSAAIRRYLAPQREAMGLLIQKDDVFSQLETHFLFLQTDRITRYIESLDLARERAIVLQGEIQNQIAEEQNQRVYVLSVVAALFLPLSFLTGVFGMNVAGLPGTNSPYAFTYLALFMFAIALLLIGYMRWKKWL